MVLELVCVILCVYLLLFFFVVFCCFFFFNDTATTEIYTLSLHDALPIWCPLCYEDGKTQGVVRDPLIWSIDAVKICPIHKQELLSQCSACGKQNTHLSRNSVPGYCTK